MITGHTIRRAPLLLALLAAAMAIAGCGTIRRATSGGANWAVPTIFAFRGVGEADIILIEDTFNRSGYPWERRSAQASYLVRGIPTTGALGRLLDDLEDSLDRPRRDDDGTTRPEVFLAQAGLEYTSLTASAGIDTRVTITVTPGAAAYIADGDTIQPWRAVPVNAQGQWTGRVDTTRAVAANNGWLYIGARAYDRITWSRTNLLTGERQAAVASTPFPEPPEDAPVMHRPDPAPRPTAPPPARESTWLERLLG